MKQYQNIEILLYTHYASIQRGKEIATQLEAWRARLEIVKRRIAEFEIKGLTASYNPSSSQTNGIADTTPEFVTLEGERDGLIARIHKGEGTEFNLSMDTADVGAAIATYNEEDREIIRLKYGNLLSNARIGMRLDPEKDESTVRRHVDDVILPGILRYLEMFSPEILRRINAESMPEKCRKNARIIPVHARGFLINCG